jgi:uncharacterized protein
VTGNSGYLYGAASESEDDWVVLSNVMAEIKRQAVLVAKGLKGINLWINKIFRINAVKAQQKQIDKIKRSTRDTYREKFIVKIPAKWMREFLAYDPAEDLPKIAVPVLAISGSKDIQMDPADLERMAKLVKAPFEPHLIQGMTHMLRTEEGEPSMAKYPAEIRRPIAPQISEIVLHWLEKWTNQAT